MEKINYSEIFRSMQGEGKYTGRPTAWLRLFGCNLQCNGFGQKDPTDSKSYILPYQDFDISKTKTMEDLPVWKYGCDSSYSWSKKYKHLAHQDTPSDLAKKLIDLWYIGDEPWKNIHLCFTGGEPLLPKNQKAILDVLTAWSDESGLDMTWPDNITIETNGTKPLLEDFRNFGLCNTNILFSCSPKLFTVSGEKNEKAIRPDIVKEYNDFGDLQLKFVLGKDCKQWEELDRVIDLYRKEIKDPDIWIMPVGATEESQQDIAGEVANMAIARGFSVSARVHTYLWGNIIGV